MPNLTDKQKEEIARLRRQVTTFQRGIRQNQSFIDSGMEPPKGLSYSGAITRFEKGIESTQKQINSIIKNATPPGQTSKTKSYYPKKYGKQ